MAGIGFEIWTMDEDILFDNIYVGHSIEDAREFAKQTFDEKLAIEQQTEKKEEDAKKAEDAKKDGAESPLGLAAVKERLTAFVQAAKQDPVGAVRDDPSFAGLIGAAVMGLIGLVGFVGGIAGGASKGPAGKSAVKPAKKVDQPSTAKSSAVAPKEDAKKRSTVTTAKDEDDE